MPRHWQVVLLAALGIGATVVAVPRALSGTVAAVPADTETMSRITVTTQSPKASSTTIPVWKPSPTPSASKGPDTQPPTAVANLRLVTNSDTLVSLSWTASEDDVAVSVYMVRGDGVASVQTPTTSVTLTTPRRTSTITVEVCAVDTSGNQSQWRGIAVVPATQTRPTATSAPTSAATVASTAPTQVPADPTTTPTKPTSESSEPELQTSPAQVPAGSTSVQVDALPPTPA